MPRTVTCYGASVRGPIHQLEGTPNEDAWLRATGNFGSLAVVCDGVGSSPHARSGAKAACIAVREAVARWAEVDGAPTEYLAYLIEIFWRLRIHPYEPKDAATTCLIAFACHTGEWVVGGIGDGLVAVMTEDQSVLRIIGDRGDDFSNETISLGSSPGLKAWKLSLLPSTPCERIAVLATDGIADDLNIDKLDGFCSWVVDKFQNMDSAARWRQLASELRAWPTPKHLDDKTIAILKVSAEVCEGKV